MAILFDTGALERLRRGERDAEALAIRHYPPLICAHVAAEFLYGQLWAEVSPAAIEEARSFLRSFEILTPTFETVAIYARLRAALRRSGRTLPEPDYWVAAHAIEEAIPLVSTDGHFSAIPEVDLHLI